MTIQSANYKAPACQSGVGNVNVDVMSYTFATTAEAADTTILLRRMTEYNQYIDIKVYDGDGAMVGAIDVGYVSRDSDHNDDLDAFGDGLNLATASHTLLTIPVKVAFKHDLALTIKTNNAANAGDTVTVVATFVCDAG